MTSKSHVYVFRAAHGVKIGITNDAEVRRRYLEKGAGVPIEVVGVFSLNGEKAWAVERRIHEQLGDFRGLGEWFTCSPERALHVVRDTLGVSPLSAGERATGAVITTRAQMKLRTLRELRLEAGLSLTGLQDASGVNRAIISQIERGRLVATREELDAIAAAMGIPASELEVRTIVVREEKP